MATLPMAVEKSSSGTSTPSTTSTMDRFQKIVLSWDYLHLIAESKVHAHQPHHTCHPPDIPSKSLTFSGHGGQGGKQAKVLQHVKNTYVSVAEYLVSLSHCSLRRSRHRSSRDAVTTRKVRTHAPALCFLLTSACCLLLIHW